MLSQSAVNAENATDKMTISQFSFVFMSSVIKYVYCIICVLVYAVSCVEIYAVRRVLKP